MQYTINNSATSKSGKQLSFATVMLGEVNLARELLSEGYLHRSHPDHAHLPHSLVKAKQPVGDKAPGKEQAELIALQEQAQTEGKGVRHPRH